MPKAPTPPAIRFVLATMVINAMGFGIIVPVTPQLLLDLGAGSIDRATAIGGWLALTFAAFQFVCSPIIGNLSDRFGRRPILMLSVAGFAIDFLALALAPSLFWVFVARAISGIFGASNAPAQAAIADITAPEERSRYFGMVGAAFGIGFVLGPALGGLLGEMGARVPFFVAAALAFCNFLYGYFKFEETLKFENRRAFDWRRATPGGSLANIRKLPGIVPIATAYLLWQIAGLVYPLIWPYFTIGRYGWTESVVGLSLALVGVSMAVIQIFALPRIVAKFGERKTALIGVTSASLTMLLYAGATQSWMAFALIPGMALQSLVHPNLTAMMTRRAKADNQGEVQGFASAVMAVGSLIAPLLYNPLHAWFTGPAAPTPFYGAAFIAAAIAGFACVPILLIMKRAERPDAASAMQHSGS